MRAKIVLIAAVPGSGKTWVCDQLKDLYTHIPHDDFMKEKGNAYLNTALEAANNSNKPILIETPFSVSKFTEPMKKMGLYAHMEVVFIIESEETTSKRYFEREKKDIPAGHLTRIETYIDRAEELGSFKGTAAQVLEYLKKKV